MKYLLIAIAAMIFLFAACEKKGTVTHCYICIGYDSVFSNIPGYGEGPTTIEETDSVCGQTDGTIAFIMKSHFWIDTYYHHNDTFKMNYHTYGCSRAD